MYKLYFVTAIFFGGDYLLFSSIPFLYYFLPFVLYINYNIYFIKSQLRRAFVNYMNYSARFLKISTNSCVYDKDSVFNYGI